MRGIRAKLGSLLLSKIFLVAPKYQLQDKEEEFEHIYQQALKNGNGTLIDYQSKYPKHQFIKYLSESKSVLFHGSNNTDIVEFEPREQTLYNGKMTKGIFATQDSIWALFYAIYNKSKMRGSMRNACLVVTNSNKELNRFYFFSINRDMLMNDPWTVGMLYILPIENFQRASNGWLRFDEWISHEPIKYIAKIKITAEDFPFLSQVSGHEEKESVIKSWLAYKKRLRNKVYQ